MTALNFHKSFQEPIVEGSKLHTLRSIYNSNWEESKRNWPKVDGSLQLYTAMRTKHCRRIVPFDLKCTRFEEIVITFCAESFYRIFIGGKRIPVKDWMQFAQDDGFKDPEVMHRYWIYKLPHLVYDNEFHGKLIGWGCTCVSKGPSIELPDVKFTVCRKCRGVQRSTKSAEVVAA